MGESKIYDYIIIGAGAAGLMLADAMITDDFFIGKSILVLDKDAKQSNDRTWCFWEKGQGRFDAIVFRKWQYIFFAGKKHRKRYNIAPYSYKMIRGIDFYNSLLEQFERHPDVRFQVGEVISVKDEGKLVTVTTTNETFLAKKAFNSIFDYGMAVGQNEYPVLQQHFIGWFIKSDTPVFSKRPSYLYGLFHSTKRKYTLYVRAALFGI